MAKRRADPFTKDLEQLALLTVAAPFYLIFGAARLVSRLKFARLARQRAIACRTCGGEILLVGFWRCRCGYTYRGHLLRICPVCRTLPAMIRCDHCQATESVRS